MSRWNSWVLCLHTCWGADHVAPAPITERRVLGDGRIRYDGTRCDGSRISLIEGPGEGDDLTPGWSNPCSCWAGDRPAAHSGHCCFKEPECPEHDELARAWVEKLPVGDVPMYELSDTQ